NHCHSACALSRSLLGRPSAARESDELHPARGVHHAPDPAGHVRDAASTHWLATTTAQAVLERGGTAVDAAVAAGFVLHVVEPHLNGPGGDLVALVSTADEPAPRVLMGQGPAPAAAS